MRALAGDAGPRTSSTPPFSSSAWRNWAALSHVHAARSHRASSISAGGLRAFDPSRARRASSASPWHTRTRQPYDPSPEKWRASSAAFSSASARFGTTKSATRGVWSWRHSARASSASATSVLPPEAGAL